MKAISSAGPSMVASIEISLDPVSSDLGEISTARLVVAGVNVRRTTLVALAGDNLGLLAGFQEAPPW